MSEVDVAALRDRLSDREIAEVDEMLAPAAELYRKLVAARAEIEGLRERLARQDAAYEAMQTRYMRADAVIDAWRHTLELSVDILARMDAMNRRRTRLGGPGDERVSARTPTTTPVIAICGIVSLSGLYGEPLACGFKPGHGGTHAWASLPTYVQTRSKQLIAKIREDQRDTTGEVTAVMVSRKSRD